MGSARHSGRGPDGTVRRRSQPRQRKTAVTPGSALANGLRHPVLGPPELVEGSENLMFREAPKVEIKHVCHSCGEVMAVHEHSNYQEVKNCLRGMKPLCEECASYPGCPLPADETRGQEELNRG
jgi:hypothetical protein